EARQRPETNGIQVGKGRWSASMNKSRLYDKQRRAAFSDQIQNCTMFYPSPADRQQRHERRAFHEYHPARSACHLWEQAEPLMNARSRSLCQPDLLIAPYFGIQEIMGWTSEPVGGQEAEHASSGSHYVCG